MRTLPFAHDHAMPALGLGTWKSTPGEVGTAVKEAIRLGYRHIDCASIYGNQAEIGDAIASCIADGVVARDELWITSKLWNDAHHPEDVAPALDQTLRELRLEYLDLYLVHWPIAQRRGVLMPNSASDFVSLDEVPLAVTWSALEQTVDAGKCRHLGVSNFSVAKLGILLDTARIRPECNQVEMHPYHQQRDLLASCRERGVNVTAYSPLGSADRPGRLRQGQQPPQLLDDPILSAVAGRHGVSVAQVALAWAMQRGTAVIPKSVNPGRLAQNLAAAELVLTEQDMHQIDGLERRRRYITGEFWVRPGGPYTLENLWDE